MKFSECHPVISFLFYIGAFVMSMCFLHPAFLACSLVCGLLYYWVAKKEILGYIKSVFGLAAVLTFLNPVFNTYGETVLFTWFHGRPYTLEAIYYGMALAVMFVTILTWFATYNEVMTSDKFLYCFGRLAPSISLILTMVFRLVPAFQKKAEQITEARRGIGKSADQGTWREKAEHGMTTVSALTTWALEGGIVTADSMQSRGFGCGKRTSFSIYHFGKKEWMLGGTMIVLLAVLTACWAGGGMEAAYTPELCVTGLENGWMRMGLMSYALFLAIPSLMDITEEIRWHILRSKI